MQVLQTCSGPGVYSAGPSPISVPAWARRPIPAHVHTTHGFWGDKALPQVRIPINDLYPVRIAFHALPDDQGSIIERARDERNHFQGSGPVGARVPRVAAKGATRG